MLGAGGAFNFTTYSLTYQQQRDLSNEITLLERAIRSQASRGEFYVLYLPRFVGLPTGDVMNDAALTEMQRAFRDAIISAGYFVRMDAQTGYWRIEWSEVSTRLEDVALYSIRTTVVPGAIVTPTLNKISEFFDNQTMDVQIKAALNEATPGGDIDETTFGASPSAFYEYVVMARQTDMSVDFSSDLRQWLVSSGLGYSSANTNVFRVM